MPDDVIDCYVDGYLRKEGLLRLDELGWIIRKLSTYPENTPLKFEF